MQTAQSAPYAFTCINAGIDWITCTAQGRSARKSFLAQAEGILQQEASAGVDITSARLRDYVGWRAPGVYVGSRRGDDICVLSASHAARLWKDVARASTNVSRLDIQVTVWTHGEQPALSRWYYQRARRQPAKRGRPRSFSLIQSHPHGDTLYVGKRQSDCFGRVYDYAAAHAQGLPRTLWRYEVEFKRHMARGYSASLLSAVSDRVATESLVHRWYDTRGLQPSWEGNKLLASQVPVLEERDRDTLAWFETSVSKTIRRAIRRHGLKQTIDSLGLSGLVIPNPAKEDSAYASLAPSTLSVRDYRRAARSVDADTISRDKPD